MADSSSPCHRFHLVDALLSAGLHTQFDQLGRSRINAIRVMGAGAYLKRLAMVDRFRGCRIGHSSRTPVDSKARGKVSASLRKVLRAAAAGSISSSAWRLIHDQKIN